MFSVARGKHLRRVGDGKRVLTEIGIKQLKGAVRTRSGKISYAIEPPYLPTSLRQDLHPGGNSLCFAIQIAALMGASPIYAVGFTLQNGLGYFHGRTNPVTKRTTVYESERALAWCRWFSKEFPGRVLLDPSFSGPIYDVFPTFDPDSLR